MQTRSLWGFIAVKCRKHQTQLHGAFVCCAMHFLFFSTFTAYAVYRNYDILLNTNAYSGSILVSYAEVFLAPVHKLFFISPLRARTVLGGRCQAQRLNFGQLKSSTSFAIRQPAKGGLWAWAMCAVSKATTCPDLPIPILLRQDWFPW